MAFAGCADSFDTGSTVERETTDGTAVTHESTHEYEVLSVRSDDEDPFIYPDGAAPQSDADVDRPPRYTRSFFVIDEDDADALRIDSDETSSEATEVREFVADTDFGTESIVVDQRPIGDCYHRHVLSVRAMDDRFRRQYCRTLKDPMAACEADTDVMEAIVFRIHRPYEEEPSSHSSSESASCRGPIIEVETGSETNSDGNASVDEAAIDGEEGDRE